MLLPLQKLNNLSRQDYLQHQCLAGLILLCLLLAFASHADADQSSTIVKWKDDKGVTHYADTIPAEYAEHESAVISKQGITVKRNKPVNPQAAVLYQQKLAQEKKDRALLSTFSNENEIDLALARNLQLDQVVLENLQHDKTNSEKRLAASQKTLTLLSKNSKIIPPDLTLEIANNQADIEQLTQRINARQVNISNLKQRFAQDKERYLALSKHNANNDKLIKITPVIGVPVSMP